MQKVKYTRQRKAVLLAQRNIQPVVGSCRLQLEIERPAKPFPQRQSPRLVDPPAKRRVNHKLHASALIEKPLRNHRGKCRHRSQNSAALQNVLDDLLRPPIVQAAFELQKINRRSWS